MLDRSDRLTLYINALLAAFGIIFALFSGFYLLGFIFTACALLLIYDLYRQSKTLFTINHLDKTLTFLDSKGHKAKETQKINATANKSGLTEFWINNISTDGIISYISINGAPPSQRKQENDKTRVAMQFEAPTKAGNTFEVTLSVGHQNAFTQTQETFAHIIDNETKLLRMIVELPAGRQAGFASLTRRYKGTEKQLPPPIITEHGKIVADIKNPPLGAEYCLHWDWPKAKLLDKLDNLFFYK